MAHPLRTYEDYQIGIICALATEKAAMVAMLDESHPRLKKENGDDNEYTLGRIGVHNVVIACLPAGLMGNGPAATVAKNMQGSFPIKFGLMVGVGGGVWSKKDDIRLGDVVVSQPTGTHGGVVQWDYGKMGKDGKFQRTGSLNKPPLVLLHALQILKERDITDGIDIEGSLSLMVQNKPRMGEDYRYQGAKHDQLFKATYNHKGDKTCEECDANLIIWRPDRKDSTPKIHYGNIASGNEVMKHGITRDKIAKEEGVICFEMEAAGLMDSFPCLVIRGICDYADSHKNKIWQPYAAATAAAFARELLGFIDEQKVIKTPFSSRVKPEALSTVPFAQDTMFVGRVDIMADLEAIFFAPQPHQRVALIGLGGMGKSQIAIEYSYRLRAKSPSTWVFWIHASSFTRFEQGYRDIANRLKLPNRDNPKFDILQMVSQWLQDETNGSWLLILDNADDANMFTYVRDIIGGQPTHCKGEMSHQSLLKYIPQTSNCSVLVTSRNSDAAARIIGSNNMISVGLMSETESLALLKAKLGHEPSDVDSLELIQALGQIPLAITQAAAYISRPARRMNVAKYLDLFHKSEMYQSSLLDNDEGDLRRDPHVPNAVISTWQISFNQIQRENPFAADLLSLMSALNRQGISESFLQGDGDQLAFADALTVLCGFSLIIEESRGGYFEMHRLVQLATRKWLDAHGEMIKWNQKALMMVSKVFPTGSFENWMECAMLLPHAEAVLSSSLLDRDDLLNKALILHNLSWYLWLKGDFWLSKLKIDHAVEIRRDHLGTKDSALLASMGLCATVLSDQGRYEEAERMHRQTLELKEEVLGLEHPETLTSMSNLALVLSDQGRYEEAERMHRQTLELKEEVLGLEHPETLTSMSNLALVLSRQGRYEEAERMHRQTLELKEKVLGLKHPLTLTSMSNLASVLSHQGRYEEAERMHRQTLELKEKVLGLEHPETLTSMSNLALVLSRQGRYEEAERMHRQTLELTEKVLGLEHPSTLTSMSNLALVLSDQGRYEEAERMHRQTLELTEKVLGLEHPSTLTSMNEIGVVLSRQGRYEEAERMHRQTLELKEKVLGLEHPETLTSMSNLALVLSRQGRYEEAERMHRQTLELKEKVLGLEHPSTLTSMNEIGVVLSDQGRYEEAERMHRQTLELMEKVLGLEHPSTLTSMSNLALVLSRQGRYEEAERMHRQTLELKEKVLGLEHPSTLTSMNEIGVVLSDQGRYEEAERMHRQTLELMDKVLGLEHPSTLTSMSNLALVLSRQGRYEEAERMHRQTLELKEKVLGLSTLRR